MSDALVEQPSEGAQVHAAELASHLRRAHDAVVLPWAFAPSRGFHLAPLKVLLRERLPVTYLAQSGLTIATIMRAAILRLVTGQRVELVVMQVPRAVPRWSRAIVAFAVDRIVVDNETQSQRLDGLGMGVDLSTPRSHLRAPDGLSKRAAKERLGWGEGVHALHVGHLRPGRGLSLLRETATVATVHIVVSPYRTPVQEAVREVGAFAEVTHGYVPDIATWYRAADVYVFPTTREDEVTGMPKSVVEALAAGTPVVALRSPMMQRLTDWPGVTIVEHADDLRRAVEEVAAAAVSVDSPPMAARHECGTDIRACLSHSTVQVRGLQLDPPRPSRTV